MEKLSVTVKSAIGGSMAISDALEENSPTNAIRTLLAGFSSTVDSIDLSEPGTVLITELAEPDPSRVTESDQNTIVPDWNNLLGFGNSGTVVYSGTWKGREVAVKVVFQSSDNKQVLREVEALSKLGSHPNILSYFHCHQDPEGDRYFLALEKCQATLKKLIEQPVAVSLSVPLVKPEILFQAISGLAYLHEKGLLHRDLKPSNILISIDSFSIAWVKLADFGISKFLCSENSCATVTGAVGTEKWRSPEVIEYLEWKNGLYDYDDVEQEEIKIVNILHFH